MENSGTQVPFQSGKKLTLRVAGDLHILGSAEEELLVLSRHPRMLQVQEDGGLVRVVSNEDVWVRVLAGADVRVEHVGGDAVIAGLTGAVEIVSVGGDLSQSGAGKLDIDQVGGDLTLTGVSGMLTVRRVGGDFIGDVAGSIAVDMVGGDSKLRTAGGARLRTGGDIALGVADPSANDEVVLRAGGDIDLFVSGETNAQLDLSSGGRDIDVSVKGQYGSYEQENLVLTLGSGGRSIRMKAGGDIKVTDVPLEMGNLQDAFAHVEEDFAAPYVRMHGSDRVHDAKYWADVEARIQERASKAARRAEERVRVAMERVERDNRRRERSLGKWEKRFGFYAAGVETPQPPQAPAYPPPPAPAPMAGHPEPVVDARESEEPRAQAPVAESQEPPYDYAAVASSITNEERMLVLKMLQEHKITVEEAEQLLAELEGQFDL